MTKRILVTGGAGFLGSHLCADLLRDGHEVLCVDNFFTGRRRNIAALLDDRNFELLRHDVTFPLFVEVDEIFNLACPASPIHYQFDPVQTTKTSVIGAINMLGLAKRLRARIFQASTSEVYGDPAVHPQPESYWGHVNTLGPRACYDEGKRCAETLFFDYHRQHKVQIKVARIFNTYGPNMNPQDGRVVSNFIVQALTGRPLTLYGEGTQTRSFCYCDDLIAEFPPPDGLGSGGDGAGQSRQPRRVHHAPARRDGARPDGLGLQKSSTSRCRSTTRASASPTSPWRARHSAGSRRSRCGRGSRAPSPISRRCSPRPSRHRRNERAGLGYPLIGRA